MNDRYGAAGAEEDDASVPTSPIAPASAAESEDDAFCTEDAAGPDMSRVKSPSPAPRNVSVARSLLYDEDTSFGSLASFGRSPADHAADRAADASVDSAAFSDDTEADAKAPEDASSFGVVAADDASSAPPPSDDAPSDDDAARAAKTDAPPTFAELGLPKSLCAALEAVGF